MRESNVLLAFLAIAAVFFILATLFGVFICPRFVEDCYQEYLAFKNVRFKRMRRNQSWNVRGSLFYLWVRICWNIRQGVTAGERRRKLEELEKKVEEMKETKAWICRGCGRKNHDFQEICACGQRRSDNFQ